MSRMTSNCEIVENTACGKAFQYCRTHKVEPHQCPGAKQEVVFQTPWMELKPRQSWTTPIPVPTAKREFKVGDKVRCLKMEYGNETVGKVYTVIQVDPRCPLGLDITVSSDDYGNRSSYRSKNFEVAE